MPRPAKTRDEKAVTISCVMYPDEVAFLTARAKARRISRSLLLRELLSDWIKKEKENEHGKNHLPASRDF